ncbi:MAG TPA: metal-dependent transcriptional regulator [Chloroflexia bacterium]|nr:metal-dependent transcriptional regulator [Chloroflexia bacterium]
MAAKGVDHHNHDNKEGETKVSPLVEEYLESILNLTAEGKPAIGARLAERMNVKPATVVGAVERLQRDGYVRVDERSKEINLTESGRKVAISLARRHRLAERLLVDVLGLNWAEAHDEACELEHAISPRVEQALTAFLGNPQTCPHGNPIPGSGAVVNPNSKPLKQVPIGTAVSVAFISEEAEHEPGLLQYLQEHGLIPGAKLKVKAVAPFDETITAEHTDGREVVLGQKTAQRIWVIPE